MPGDDTTIAEGVGVDGEFLNTFLRTFVIAEALGLTTGGQIKADIDHPLYGPLTLTAERKED